MRPDTRGQMLAVRQCEYCTRDYQPRMAIQVTCSAACSKKINHRKKAAHRKAEREAERRSNPPGVKVNMAEYKLVDVLPYDLDMLYAKFDAMEVDAMLQESSFPECALVTHNGIEYEVFSHIAGNGKTYQRLISNDGRVIMCKAERRICV